MKALVLLNDSAGAAGATITGSAASVTELLAAAGIAAEVRSVTSENLRTEADGAAARNVEVVIAAGGDGTISAVAQALAGTQMPLGVLPLGTLNHFAKDLGIPLDLAGAAQVIAARQIARIDVGRVNDRIFINNSSLGLYPWVVLEREAQRRRGLSKWMAMGWAILKVFRRFPLLDVYLETDGRSIVRKTPLVFAGNNHYQLDLLNVGTRSCLDRGELSLYIANSQSRWSTLKLAVQTLFGQLEQSRDFEASCLSSFRVETRRRRLRVALDGEVVSFSPPLDYRVWPQALRVCVPPKAAD